VAAAADVAVAVDAVVMVGTWEAAVAVVDVKSMSSL